MNDQALDEMARRICAEAYPGNRCVCLQPNSSCTAMRNAALAVLHSIGLTPEDAAKFKRGEVRLQRVPERQRRTVPS